MDSRILYASSGDVDEPENRQARIEAARAGERIDYRPAPPGSPDTVLELRVFVDPVNDHERWAVIASFGGEETIIDYPTEDAARMEYEQTGESFGAAIYMGWTIPR
jgi:hypothetical protein